MTANAKCSAPTTAWAQTPAAPTSKSVKNWACPSNAQGRSSKPHWRSCEDRGGHMTLLSIENPVVSKSKRISYREFLANSPEDAHVEWVNGEVVPMAPI